MNVFIAILLIAAYIVLLISNIIIDIKYQKQVKEITDISWELLKQKSKIRTILLESELINEDKTITLEKIEKVLASDYQSKTNTSKTHV